MLGSDELCDLAARAASGIRCAKLPLTFRGALQQTSDLLMARYARFHLILSQMNLALDVDGLDRGRTTR